MAYTIPPNNRAVGTPNPPQDMDNTADMLGLITRYLAQVAGTYNVDPAGNAANVTALQSLIGGSYQTPMVPPSGDNTGVSDWTNIQGLLNLTAGAVWLGLGSFYINKPLVLNQSGMRLYGSGGSTGSGDDSAKSFGTKINIVAGFTDSNPWAGQRSGAIACVMGSAGVGGGGSGSSLTSFGIRLRDFWVGGVSAPANVDAVMCLGSVLSWQAERVGVDRASGRSFGFYKDTTYGSNNYPDGMHLYSCMANGSGASVSAGQEGYWNIPADSVLVDCHAQSLGTGSDGFVINGGANSRLIGCRGDLCQNGFTCDAPTGANFHDAITLIGCGSQGNTNAGLNVVNSSGTGQLERAPVVVVGGTWDQDGTYGIFVSGRNLVTLCGTQIRTGNSFPFNSVSGSPTNGLGIATQGSGPGKPSILWVNGSLNAVTTLLSGSANANSLNIHGVTAIAGLAPTADAYTLFSAAAVSASQTVTLGSAFQNTLGYDIVLTVYLAITANTSLVVKLGVGPTNTPAQQTIITGVTLTGIVPVPIYLPSGYFALLSSTGTGTVSVMGSMSMPV